MSFLTTTVLNKDLINFVNHVLHILFLKRFILYEVWNFYYYQMLHHILNIDTNQERCGMIFPLMHFTMFTVVNYIPTTTVTLITCVAGIPLVINKNTKYKQQSYHNNTANFNGINIVGIHLF